MKRQKPSFLFPQCLMSLLLFTHHKISPMSERLTGQNEIPQGVHFVRAPYRQHTCESRTHSWSELPSDRCKPLESNVPNYAGQRNGMIARAECCTEVLKSNPAIRLNPKICERRMTATFYSQIQTHKINYKINKQKVAKTIFCIVLLALLFFSFFPFLFLTVYMFGSCNELTWQLHMGRGHHTANAGGSHTRESKSWRRCL